MDPPHFRSGDEEKSCRTCQHYGDVTAEAGWCKKYDRPMFEKELCDSWSVRGVFGLGKRGKEGLEIAYEPKEWMAKKGTPSEEQIIDALKRLRGKATVEEAMTFFQKNGESFDKTKTWDRLIIMTRKGILENRSGTFILVPHV